MDGRRIGAAFKAIRLRRGWRQVDVAKRAGVSQSTYARIEGGEVDGTTVAVLERVASALDARLRADVSWHGARLDRLIDEPHALLVGAVAQLMRDWGWVVELEVSFSHFGERGSIDLFGWHAVTASIALGEMKSELGGMDALLRPLDVKVRLAAMIARERFGWHAARTGRIVVLPEGMVTRRQVARHAAVLDVALPDRSIAVRRWLRNPSGPLRGLWFLSNTHGAGAIRSPSSVDRVRRRSGPDPDAGDRLAERETGVEGRPMIARRRAGRQTSRIPPA